MTVDYGHVTETGERERVRWVYDEWYNSRGSFGLDTEEETKAAEDYEIEMLESGQYVALVAILERQCAECGAWHFEDSVWGIVCDGTDAELDSLAKEFF